MAIRGNDYQGQSPGQLRRVSDLVPGQPDTQSLGTLLDTDGFRRPVLAADNPSHPQPAFVPGDQLRQAMGAKRTTTAENVNTFENTGLTAAIGAHKHIELIPGCAIQRRQYPYVADL